MLPMPKLLNLAILKLEDLDMNPVIFDLYQFTACEPRYDKDASGRKRTKGCLLSLKNGTRIYLRQSVQEVHEQLINAAAAIIRSRSEQDTVPVESAAGSGRMAEQQAANKQSVESAPSTPPTEPSGSDEQSSSKDMDQS